MKNWFLKGIGLNIEEINADNYDNVVNSTDMSLAYFGPENEEFEIFVNISKAYNSAKFYYSFDESFREKTESFKITLFRSFRVRKREYKGKLDYGVLTRWLFFQQQPAIYDIEHIRALERTEVELRTTFLYVDHQNHSNDTEALLNFEIVADRYSKDHNFIYSTPYSKRFKRYMKKFKFLDFKPYPLPAIFIFRSYDRAPEHNIIEWDLKVDSLDEIVRHHFSNELENLKESDPLPSPETDENGITTVVGKTWPKYRHSKTQSFVAVLYFEDDVTEEQKKTGVFQILSELALKYKDREDLVFGLVNVQSNGIDMDFSKQRGILPALVYYPTGRSTTFSQIVQKDVAKVEKFLIESIETNRKEEEERIAEMAQIEEFNENTDL